MGRREYNFYTNIWKSVISITFSLQNLNGKLLLILIWTHHLNSPHERERERTRTSNTIHHNPRALYISNFLTHNQIYAKNHSLTLITIHNSRHICNIFLLVNFFFLELCYPSTWCSLRCSWSGQNLFAMMAKAAVVTLLVLLPCLWRNYMVSAIFVKKISINTCPKSLQPKQDLPYMF